MTRREFLKGTAGFVVACGGGFGLSKLGKLLEPSPADAVGPMLREDLTLVPGLSGAEVRHDGVLCFTVNEAGLRLLRLADGRRTFDTMLKRAALSEQRVAAADFFLTLGTAGYLRNRFEVSKVVREV